MKTTFLALFAIALFSIPVYAQSNSALSQNVNALEKKAAEQPDEKVHLHLDKPYYAAGDNIWFKGYITTGQQHNLSAISRVLNVILVDDKKHIEKTIRLPVINGLTWGDIALPDSLAEGTYHLIAYTNWMRNAGNKTFFNQSLFIGNGITSKIHTKADFKNQTNTKLLGTVNFTGTDNAPLAGKTINYEWLLKSKILTRGNTQTDPNGNISVNYAKTPQKQELPDAIKSEIVLSPGKRVSKVIAIHHLADKADFQLFPESGNLVNDVYAKVAFKATGTNGLGLTVKGIITDDIGEEVASFASTHAGMGVFSFTPQSNKKYIAKVIFKDGSTGSQVLPQVLDKGYVLGVNQTNADHTTLRISTNAATLQENAGKEISLIAQANGKVSYAAQCNLQNNVYIINIPRDRFTTGVQQFTLFVAGQPVNERLAFIQNNDDLKLNITTSQPTYQPRGHVTMDLDAKSAGNQPANGSFSVSVVDESKVPVNEADESTIKTNLLLTADIKGYIEQPNYYFANADDTTRANLDALMLTQGYRKFNWKAVQTTAPTTLAYQPEKGLNISGQVLTQSEKAIPNANVTLFLKATGEVIDTVTNELGKFTFHNLIYTDTTKFVLQALNGKKNNVEIKIDPDPARQIAAETDIASPGDAVLSAGLITDYLQNSTKNYNEELRYGIGGHSRLLKEVNIKAKKATIAPELEFSNNLNGPGRADQIVLGAELENQGGDLINILRGKLTGVMFMGNKPISMANTTFRLPGSDGRPKYDPMKVILDGMMVDYTYLMMLNPSDIGSIEVLRTAAYLAVYGSSAGSGAIVITTRHGGNTAYDKKSPGMITYRPGGYYLSREFYAPRYDGPQNNSKMADLRTTIFWKPNVVTDKDGHATFDFYNADAKGTYRVTVEGIDANGTIGRTVYRYKVGE